MIKFVIGAVILILVGIIFVIKIYLMDSAFDYSSANLASLVNRSIGAPELTPSPSISVAEGINIDNPSKWERISCIPSSSDRVSFPSEEEYKYVSKEEQERVNCLRVTSLWKKYNATKCIGFGCPFTIVLKDEPPMLLTVNNYVLREPEILAKIIDVAARPCDYIQEYYKGKYFKDSSQGDIRNMQRSLLCNHKASEKPYVILELIDPSGLNNVRLLIERRDTFRELKE